MNIYGLDIKSHDIPWYLPKWWFSGTPNSSILVGLSTIIHPFWGTSTLGNLQISPKDSWFFPTLGQAGLAARQTLHPLGQQSLRGPSGFWPALETRWLGDFSWPMCSTVLVSLATKTGWFLGCWSIFQHHGGWGTRQQQKWRWTKLR